MAFNKRGKNRREKQFFCNLDTILGGYENGRMDEPDVYVNLDRAGWIEYVFPEIYHMKSNGFGGTWYGEMICGDLRFLGRKWMEEQLINEVRKEGWLDE